MPLGPVAVPLLVYVCMCVKYAERLMAATTDSSSLGVSVTKSWDEEIDFALAKCSLKRATQYSSWTAQQIDSRG